MIASAIKAARYASKLSEQFRTLRSKSTTALVL
jgi:hypothetical protein